MKYSIVALPAIAAVASAQDLNSIFNVLQTALPSSLVAEALTNSAAVSSEIASQFAAGETPSWYSALPTDIQSYFAPTDAAAVSSASSVLSSAAANLTSNPITSAPTVLGTGTLLPGGVNGTSAIGGNGTAINGSGNNTSLSTSASLSATTTSNGGAGETGTGTSESGSDASSTADSDSGASMVTGLYGMSLAGALGVVGVLAL